MQRINLAPDTSRVFRPRSLPTAAGRIFASGPVTTTVARGTVSQQTEQVFDNLEVLLQRAGSSLGRVDKVSVFLTDLSHFTAMNEVYVRRFGRHRPVRSTVQVASLPMGAQVEIEALVQR